MRTRSASLLPAMLRVLAVAIALLGVLVLPATRAGANGVASERSISDWRPGEGPDFKDGPADHYEFRSVSVGIVGRGHVTRFPDLPQYVLTSGVQLLAHPGTGFAFTGWDGDAQGGLNPMVVTVDKDLFVRALFADVAGPSVHVDFPDQGGTLILGQQALLRWTASDNDSLATADLLLSRTGPTGSFEPIALGVPATGSYLWTVAGRMTNEAVLRVVVRDAAGHSAQDLGDRTFQIKDVADYPMVRLRADRATGTGPYSVPSGFGPWKDLTGNHDATLWEFRGNLASGWKGNGTPGSPRHLEFGNEDRGYDNRVTIPAASIPELQALNPVTAEVWFKTGNNGTSSRYEYVLEWVQPPTPDLDPEWEGRGMSIVVFDGKVQVYHYPWIEVATVEPNTWYHIAVAKDTSEIRIFLNGRRVYTGNKPHLGIQLSEVVLGCATFRRFEGFPGNAIYSDYWTGAIGQMTLWRGSVSDSTVLTSFQADSALYLPNLSTTPLAPVVELRADRANGTAPYAPLTATSPWFDLLSGHHATLGGFAGDSTSGWMGDGSVGSPYRLEFDGIDDHAGIAAGSAPELASANALSAEVWFRTGSDVASVDYQQVLEWIEGFGSSPGMSVAIQDGMLQSYLANPYWEPIAPVAPNTLYHVVVAKEPGEVRIYLNGVRVFTSVYPNLGVPTSEIMFGASSWRGPGIYGEFFKGALTGVKLWRGALEDADVLASYVQAPRTPALEEQSVRSITPVAIEGLRLHGVHPNPASTTANLTFSLPSGAPARLELIDVAGRRIRSFEVGRLGAGRHAVDLAGGGVLPAGSYIVHLTQEGRSVTTKATVVR